MRRQANTAEILKSNPVVMRLLGLEILEKVADKSNIKVVLRDKDLSDRIVGLI